MPGKRARLETRLKNTLETKMLFRYCWYNYETYPRLPSISVFNRLIFPPCVQCIGMARAHSRRHGPLESMACLGYFLTCWTNVRRIGAVNLLNEYLAILMFPAVLVTAFRLWLTEGPSLQVSNLHKPATSTREIGRPPSFSGPPMALGFPGGQRDNRMYSSTNWRQNYQETEESCALFAL